MTFPTRVASANSTQSTDVTTHPITLPTGHASGHLCYILFVCDGAPTITIPSGFTRLGTDTADGSSCKVSVAYKILDGSEGSTVDFTTSASEQSAAFAQLINGYDTTTPLVGYGTPTAGPASDPDPPNSNPGSSADYTWIEFFGADDDDTTATYWSTSFNGLAQIESNTSSADSCQLCVAYRELNASSLNPAAMHQGAEEQVVAGCFAIKPGAGGAAETFTGTLASTETVDTCAASGTQVFTGTLAATETADTIVSSGTLVFTGECAVTEAGDSCEATGTEVFSGSVSTTESSDSIEASGTYTPLAISGTATATESEDTQVASGSLLFTGTLGSTESDDTQAASGSLIFTGTLESTESVDALVSSGTQLFTGALAATETSDTASGASLLVFTGTLAASETADSCAAEGTTEADDEFTGTLAASETNDSAAGTGAEIFTGTCITTEATDSPAASGLLVFTGSLTTAEDTDTASATAAGVFTGSTLVVESQDTLVAVGELVLLFAGTATPLESPDTMDATGSPATVGTASIAESADTLSAFDYRSPFVVIDAANNEYAIDLTQKEFIELQGDREYIAPLETRSLLILAKNRTFSIGFRG